MLKNISNGELLSKINKLKKQAQKECLWVLSQAKKFEDFATGDTEEQHADASVNKDWLEYVKDEYYEFTEEADNRNLKW